MFISDSRVDEVFRGSVKCEKIGGSRIFRNINIDLMEKGERLKRI